MEKRILSLPAALVCGACVALHAQDLNELAKIEMKEAVENEYTILDHGAVDTWEDGADGQSLLFDSREFQAGTNYVVVAFVNDCETCTVWMAALSDDGTRTDLDPDIARDGGIARFSASWAQIHDQTGKIFVQVRSTTHHSTYGILSSKVSR
ncbi:MAG: hypothetical protein IPP83_11335 [Flavobacteriales bacterium]|nr:hypothetical protein [Flavobacteriales bacterium]